MLNLLKRVVEKIRSKFLNLYERYLEEESSSTPAWWYYVLSSLEDIWDSICDLIEYFGIGRLIILFLLYSFGFWLACFS